MKIYSRVLISSDEVFFKHSEENIHSAEINDTSYERQADIHWDETIPITKKTKKKFLLYQYPIYHFWFKAYQSVEVDAIGIEVAQQIKLSGCLSKGHSHIAIVVSKDY